MQNKNMLGIEMCLSFEFSYGQLQHAAHDTEYYVLHDFQNKFENSIMTHLIALLSVDQLMKFL